MRALGEQDLARPYRRFSETKLGLDGFLKGKKSLKGSALLLSSNTVHLHFSNYGLSHGSNRKSALR